MSLIKSKPAFSTPSLLTDFFTDGFFDNELLNFPLTRWVPNANVRESDDEFIIELAAPGMERDEFKVEAQEDLITIEGKHEEEEEEKDESYHRKEFRTTSFKRAFRLPQTVITDKVDAKYAHGILKLTLPKREEAKSIGKKLVKIS
ncbi:MAG: Hsp20/alpha crystallin family protein [Flavobacteriales bacterium]|jgi:HSP20 family protein